MVDNDDLDEGPSPSEPRRYSLHWEEGIRPDEANMEFETVGDDEQ